MENKALAEMHCAECGEYRPEDARVAVGMRCGVCAYGNGERVLEEE